MLRVPRSKADMSLPHETHNLNGKTNSNREIKVKLRYDSGSANENWHKALWKSPAEELIIRKVRQGSED